MPIHGGEQIDGLSHIPHGSGSAEFIDSDLGRFGAHQAIQDALRRAEVDGRNNLWLAVDTLAFAQVVVGFAANDLLGEARHSVRSYHTLQLVCQRQNTTKYMNNNGQYLAYSQSINLQQIRSYIIHYVC
jgi:hypothetical protein